jgi:hypothetical protein
VQTPVVALMSKKENPAMPARDQAMPRQRVASSHRPQNSIIFQSRCPSFGLSMPAWPELKKLRDLGCKKPKLVPGMLMLLTTSSYPMATEVSRR